MNQPDSLAQAFHQATPLRWDVFCRVIDNHGDLGVCWRFATDLAGRGQQVRLWVDDASALAWMAPHGCAGVQVRAWDEANGVRGDGVDGDTAGAQASPGDVVVEAFGCDPPAGFVARMATQAQAGGAPPVWINLEYLSAEGYVERCHGLASPQFSGPGQGLVKWFWYPGFTPRTGGLLREPGLLGNLAAIDRLAVRAELLQRFQHHVDPTQARLALLFCYDNPALPTWLDALSRADRPWCVLVTPGLAMQGVQRWWQARTAAACLPFEASVDATKQQPWRLGSLSLLPLGHVDQQQFDQLLWACDLNFVRGEDSFVRAHWAGRPFVWQAYVQDDGAHHAKIAAWLQLYLDTAPQPLSQAVSAAHLAWNGSPGDMPDAANQSMHDLLGRRGAGDNQHWPAWCAWAEQRRTELAGQGDLVTQLLGFVATRRLADHPG